MVASDRISAFDAVLATEIPDKGAVLTAMSLWWFEQVAKVVPNHLITANADEYPAWLAPHRDELRGRSMLCRRLDMIGIECVIRGYLAGSGLVDYERTGAVSGHVLPPGLQVGSRLPGALFTPATKAVIGEHDENISATEAGNMVGPELVAELEEVSRAIYLRASDIAAKRGIILADTKFEFGRAGDGTLVVGDEILTPDSSRFWPADEWEPGTPPKALDKQYVRDWLIANDLRGEPAALPEDVVVVTRDRYISAYEQLTGLRFADFQSSMGL